jgi:hypothetical protein
MSYYEETQEYADRGIDYDLYTCLEYNPQKGFNVEDIKKVLAVWEGENDGDDWRWVLELNDGRYVFLQGGCDYTGWDCQSWATSEYDTDPYKSAERALGDVPISAENQPSNAGLGHMLNILGGSYGKDFENVCASLKIQIDTGKNKTWGEKKDVEFGLVKPLFKNVSDAVMLGKPVQKARKTAFTYVIEMATDFECQTMEGLVVGKAGDYLAVGIIGEVYPIAKEIFEQSYEVIDSNVDVITIGETKHLTTN